MTIRSSKRDLLRYRLGAAILSWVLMFTVIASVSAQTADDGKARPWSARVGFGQGYESNVELDQGGSADVGNRLDGGVGRDWAFRRGTVRFTGDVGQIYYHESPNLNHLTYAVGGGVSYLLTRRLSWSINESLSSDYAQDSKVLVTSGVILPKVLTRTNSAGTQFAYDLSPKTQVMASVASQSVSFASPKLVGGMNVTVRTNLTRKVTKSQSLGVSWGQTYSDGITGDIQGVLATWQAAVGTSLTVTASGGVRPYRLAGVEAYQFAPGGSAGVSLKMSPTSAATATYERAVEQAYGGTGTHLCHRINAGYAVAFGSHVQLEASYAYGLNTYPGGVTYADGTVDPDLRLVGNTLIVGARYVVVKNLAIAAGYGVWTRVENSSPSINSYRGTMTVMYGFGWR